MPDNQVSLQIDGEERTRWHFDAKYPRPFFYPLIGPSGDTLTRMGHPGAQNHDHHRSVWWAHGLRCVQPVAKMRVQTTGKETMNLYIYVNMKRVPEAAAPRCIDESADAHGAGSTKKRPEKGHDRGRSCETVRVHGLALQFLDIDAWIAAEYLTKLGRVKIDGAHVRDRRDHGRDVLRGEGALLQAVREKAAESLPDPCIYEAATWLCENTFDFVGQVWI